jgi:hypothetical protein
MPGKAKDSELSRELGIVGNWNCKTISSFEQNGTLDEHKY